MGNNTEWEKHHTILPDGGPVYAETDMGHFFVEPWNSISSLTFLVPAVWWMFQIKWKVKEYPFFSACSLLLSIGGLGSAIFHGFRYSTLFIALDVLPIVLLNIMVSLYLWNKIVESYWKVILIFIIMLTVRFAVFWMPISEHDIINLGYFIAGTFIFLPLLIILVKTSWTKLVWVVLALASLALALLFRKIDAFDPPLLPMGTHWIWHVFCAFGAYFLGKYLLYIHGKKVSSGLA